MTIRHLRIFIEVADTGKMSAAASKLYISQPTVSQAIKDLEEHYGMLLFERLSKKLYITEKGERLLSYARNIVKQFDDMEEKVFESGYVEKLRIGATITVGECLLSQIINSFKNINPQMNTYAYINNTKIIEDMLLKSELDVAIVEGRIKSTYLVSSPVIKDYLVLACSMSHPFAKRETVKLSELEKESFAMREEGSGTRELFERYMTDNGLSIKTTWLANSTKAIKNAVIENQNLAVISIRLLEGEIRDGKIYVIQNTESHWDRYFSIVYHKNKLITPQIKSLVEIVKSYKDTDILREVASGRLIK
ncbi:MAG: LysR family transcriptional regulator [Clostridiales bacterium]|nr:LysR family transcriptional regulator [Clostridiales bacterium]